MANVAVVCAPSGLFVLDVDPRSGGAESFERLRAQLGDALFDTARHRTGGGGEHFFFIAPKGPGFQPIGSLPSFPGLDLKYNGYVLAPPSNHESGESYTTVPGQGLLDREPLDLPERLRELVAPPTQRDQASESSQRHDSQTGDFQGVALALLERALGKVLNGQGRNNTALWLACQLRDSARLSEGAATPVILTYQARVEESRDHPYTSEEAIRTLRSAYSREPRSPLHADTYADGSAPKRFRTMTPEEMKEMKLPESIVGGLLFRNTLAMVSGQPGTFKTFAVLDIALSLSQGRAIWGLPLAEGTALYITPEGAEGMRQRIDAWEVVNQLTAGKECQFITDAPQLADAKDIAAIIEACSNLSQPPALVVIDTLARASVGLEENSSKDMGKVIAGCDQIRQATGACVVLVHHDTKDGRAARGSSALLGAMDTVIRLDRTEGKDYVTVKVVKQKHAAEMTPFHLGLRVVQLDEYGSESCVLVRSHGRTSPTSENTTSLRVLRVLATKFASEGAIATRWAEASKDAGVTGERFYKAKEWLLEQGLVGRDKTKGKRGALFFLTEEGKAALNDT